MWLLYSFFNDVKSLDIYRFNVHFCIKYRLKRLFGGMAASMFIKRFGSVELMAVKL